MAIGLTRQVIFWAAALAVFIILLWLLHSVMLPFVAGMVLAYLFDPLANRIEQLGVNRLLATLVIIGLFILIFVLLIILVAPFPFAQSRAPVHNLPNYVARVQQLIADSNREWLNKLVGDSLGGAELGTMVKQGAGGVTDFLRSLWTGGRALISIFSLLVITPVVAFYLLNDWNRVVSAIDNWLPRAHADTIRALAREIDT